MAVRSANLAVGTAPTSVVTTVATVPSGETWIVKDVHVYSSGANTRALVGAARGSLLVPFTDGGLGVGGGRGGLPWIVLEPGDKIQVYAEGSGFDYWVSGAMLTGVA